MSTFEETMRKMRDPSTARGRNHLRWLRAWRIRDRVMRDTMGRIPLIGGVLVSFWQAAIGESVDDPFFSLGRGIWGVDGDWLGDALFWEKPMTEDYYKSWLSRVPWPRWLHVHMAYSYPFWKDEETGKRQQPREVCTRRRK
jgi:hypothetical protein